MIEYLIKVLYSGDYRTINIIDSLHDYYDIDYELLTFNYITDKQIVINYFINYLKKVYKKFG